MTKKVAKRSAAKKTSGSPKSRVRALIAANEAKKQPASKPAAKPAAAPKGTKKPEAAKKAVPAKKEKAKPLSIRAKAHELVKAGKTNAEIFVELQKLGLPEAKRSYVAWYRSECLRLGLVTPEVGKQKPKEKAPKAAAKKKAAKPDVDVEPEATLKF